MIRGAAATIILIAILTIWMQRRHGETPTKAKFVIPLWGVGAAFVVLTATTVWWFSAVRDYDACTSKVERSLGNRAQNEQLFATIDAATGTTHYTSDVIVPGVPSLRDALNINLPQLTLASCEELKP